MDINTISRKLHIRPDILHAMEEGDFERLPDRGYARNMVRGYAHIVGLDQNLISQMYLEELHLYETGRPLAGSASNSRSGFSAGNRVTIIADTGRSSRNAPRQEVQSNNPRGSRGVPSQSSQRVYQASSSSKRRGSNSSRTSRASGVSATSGAERRSSRPSSAPRSTSARNDSARTQRRGGQQARASQRRSSGPSVPLTSLFSGGNSRRKQSGKDSVRPGMPSIYTQSRRTTPTVGQPTLKMSALVALAIVAVLVIVLAIVLSSGSKQAVEEVPQIPISGLTDTSGSSTSSSGVSATGTADTSQKSKTTASNKLTYTIEDGAKAWVQITVDGEDEALVEEVLEGPLTKTIDITAETTFKTANPDPISLTFNSEEVKLQNLSGTEYYTYVATPVSDDSSTTSNNSDDSDDQ